MNESSVVPAPGWVLVRRNLPAKMTAGGIHIPETARSQHPGITPGEASKVEVLAVSDIDANEADFREDDLVDIDGFEYRLPLVGEIVFVNATNDNMVPVVTDEYGQVTMANGFQVPETYLFKLSAIAGYVAQKETV